MEYRYYLSLGSNVGDALANVGRAVDRLKELKKSEFLQSEYYVTEAQDYEDQRDFVNLCVYMDSETPPFEFLSRIKAIERELGRVETFRFGPRVIDIDIIWISGVKISSDILEVPHPRAFGRAFVLHPLREIAASDGELLAKIEENIAGVKHQRVEKGMMKCF